MNSAEQLTGFQVRKLFLILLSFMAILQAGFILSYVSMNPLFETGRRILHASAFNNYFAQKTMTKDPTTAESRLLLLLIVSSAPHRFARREAIRRTWWKSCKSYPKIKCLFFTDGDIDDRDVRLDVVNEQSEHGDIILQPFSGGGSFGKRFLHHLTWANKSYKYEYFMRLDDDMMLCIDRLVLDLLEAPKSRLIWSWFHCVPNIVRPEESFIIISRDLVEMFLSQNKSTMLCHALADQQVALWVRDLQLMDSYHSDQRVHHHPPASLVLDTLNRTSICHSYIALHGVYEMDMLALWANRGPATGYPTWKVPPLSQVCSTPPVFLWHLFHSPYYYEPKLCASNPTWDTTSLMGGAEKFFKGREG